jgi:ubiquinol-cytochrome c reductase subunit 6
MRKLKFVPWKIRNLVFIILKKMSSFGFPSGDETTDFPKMTKNMLERGEDPKELLIEFCRPQCDFWEGKLKRCETALQSMVNADPTKSCMYPLRDWVTCIDGCVIIFEYP